MSWLAQKIKRSLIFDINASMDMVGRTRLYKAVESNDFNEIDYLIHEGADVNKARTDTGETPLLYAISVGSLPIIDKLIAAGADVNKARTDTGETPLFAAVFRDSLPIIDKLIAAGADVNKSRTDRARHIFDHVKGTTPLYIAVHRDNARIVEKLIAAGADVNKPRNGNNDTPLNIAASVGLLNMVEILILAGANIHTIRTGLEKTPLESAIYENHLDVVKKLIAAGADVNRVMDRHENTPIWLAIEYSNDEMVETLINAGAKVNTINNYGVTPLLFAMELIESEEMSKTIKKLIDNGANIHVKMERTGVTPLIVASTQGHSGIIKKLIQLGAKVNDARTDNGKTPIYCASESGHADVVKLLIQYRADVNKTASNGKTPIYVASEQNHADIVRLLINANADINKARTDNGETPLHIAVKHQHASIVKTLIQAGADKTIKTRNGRLPENLTKNKKILAILKGEDSDEDQLKWDGWTQGDASRLDGIFGDDETAKNFALCPVCMKYVIRADACMYMTHNCSALKGYHHDSLYQKYKNSQGEINWCTICGRICKGHNHYELSSANDPVPSILPGKNVFAKSCEIEGGGGIKEKLLRFRRLREYAKQLQNEVGKIGWWQAMDELCEEMWNAPLFEEPSLTRMLETRKFNIPSTNFPLTLPHQKNAPNTPFLGELPILHPEETNSISNGLFIDDVNLIQFRHARSNGTMNLHDKPGQQVSREGFVHWLKTQLEDPTAEGFGKCWQFKTRQQQSVLSNVEKANVCDAILHPEEVNAALDLTNPEHVHLAEGYRKAFNVAMDTRKTVRE